MILLRGIPQPWQLYDKIRIFQCRVDVWNLGVAVQIMKQIESQSRDSQSIWAHAAYGMLAITFSYFEMIGKTLNPNSKNPNSKRKGDKGNSAGIDFNYGFCDVYPEYRPPSRDYKDTNLPKVKVFRDRVRNGMYHLAYTKRNLLIHNCPRRISTKDFDVIEGTVGNQSIDLYCVNPHSVVRTIVDHFPKFIRRLQNPDKQYDDLRRRFVRFFDDFHDA